MLATPLPVLVCFDVGRFNNRPLLASVKRGWLAALAKRTLGASERGTEESEVLLDSAPALRVV